MYKYEGISIAMFLVSLSVPRQETAEIMPYVFGGRLTGEYELEGLHFHWGNKNNLGSEHTFNDVRFPMEMHIIHRNRKYGTTAEALEHRDGLTVLAFFYQVCIFQQSTSE